MGDKYLMEVWGFLTNKWVGHKELWLDYRPWPSYIISPTVSPAWTEQQIVVTRSGRVLAQLSADGQLWHYGSGVYPLTFDPALDSGTTPPFSFYLDADFISEKIGLLYKMPGGIYQ